ncbi:hypothetical protein DVA81_18965, partial [Acinetobacter baumannii]
YLLFGFLFVFLSFVCSILVLIGSHSLLYIFSKSGTYLNIHVRSYGLYINLGHQVIAAELPTELTSIKLAQRACVAAA